jgi:hypothetical protein
MAKYPNTSRENIKVRSEEGLAEFRKPFELAAIRGNKIEGSIPKGGKI